MAQQATMLIILAENINSHPLHTHLEKLKTNCLEHKLQGKQCPLLASMDTTLTFTYAPTHTYTYQIKNETNPYEALFAFTIRYSKTYLRLFIRQKGMHF